MAGFWDFTFNDILKGASAVATAYGSIEANKIQKDQLAYEKSRDAAADAKEDIAQDNLSSALDNVYGVKKKKKSTTPTVDGAYGTVQTELAS